MFRVMIRPLIPILICVALLGTACFVSVGDRIEESPLATWDPSTSDYMFEASSGAGTLEIEEQCVYLVQDTNEGQQKTLLVWPEPTSWNADSQAIDLVDFDGGRQELHDGDLIAAGGVGVGGENPGEEPAITPSYVSPPDASCDTTLQFVIGWIELNPDIK